MPFDIAKPISKAEFLAVYKDSVAVTQLIFAPFGLTTSIVDILGGSKALEVYTLMFQQWEDLVSKKVFTSRGFNDDRIIASMHKFIGKTQDADVRLSSFTGLVYLISALYYYHRLLVKLDQLRKL